MKTFFKKLFCGVLSVALLTSSALAATIQPSTDKIELKPNITAVTFTISVTADTAFAGVEFGLQPSSSDVTFSRVEYLGKAEGLGNVDTVKDGVLYFGCFTDENVFEEKTTHEIARVTYEYTGKADRTISLVSSNVVTVDADNKTTSGDKTSAPFTVTIERETSGGGSGGGSTGGHTGGNTDDADENLPSYKNPFVDVKQGDWFAESVQYAVEHQLMNGVSDTEFAPNAYMTRAMFVTVLARMEGVDTSKSSPWYEVGRQWAMEKGISDGTNMEGTITREQLASMLYRYSGSPAVSGVITGFSDTASVSQWAEDAMLWAVQNGIISGSNGQLNPQGNATRAEVATMLMRFCQQQ